MNAKLLVSCLALAVVVVVSACGAPAATEQPGPTESPTEESAPTEAPTETATEAPGSPLFDLAPFVPQQDKPPLGFSQPVDGVGDQIIAFTLPVFASLQSWTVPIIVAPYKDVMLNPAGELTSVGVVEIGPAGSVAPGIYVVLIDLGTSDAQEVSGRLEPITASAPQDVLFSRIPQKLNPDRGDGAAYDEFKTLTPPQNVSASISADGVCFVVRVDEAPTYIRYCSQSGSVLSVRTSFGSQYESLITPIFTAAQRFGLQDVIDTDQMISEMEDPGSLETCGEAVTSLDGKSVTDLQGGACGSDITVAPLKNVELREVKQAQSGSPFVLTSFKFVEVSPTAVAVVKIHQQIQTSISLVLPGEYQMDYWFDPDGNFVAATISGVVLDEAGNEIDGVTNQQVPAVPATFVNEDESTQSGAQISACRILGRCTFFQKVCP